MPQIETGVPDALHDHAEAARAWFAGAQGAPFKITGIVEPEHALTTGDDNQRDLKLILCGSKDGQELCLREDFRVIRQADGSGFEVTHQRHEPGIASPAPLLDPPEGERAGWLQAKLSEHTFVLLLFYRGFW